MDVFSARETREAEAMRKAEADMKLDAEARLRQIERAKDAPGQLDAQADHTSKTLGHPEKSAQHWRLQEGPNDCALYAQGGILDRFGVPFDINTYRAEAQQAGYYTPDTGTTPDGVGDLLERHGVAVKRYDGATMQDLANEVQQGHGVVAMVECTPLWGLDGLDKGHALWVTGVNVNNTNGRVESVVCNDSGLPNGKAITYPADAFAEAWKHIDYRMVCTEKPMPGAGGA